MLIRTLMSVVVLSTMLIFRTAQADGAEFDCSAAMAGNAQQQRQAAVELLYDTWDTSHLACAAQVLIVIAEDKASDFDAQLSALQANAQYIYYLDRIILYELGYLIVWYNTDVPKEKMLSEPMIALVAAQQEQQRILQQAHDAGFDRAELNYFESLSIGVNAQALPLLKGVVGADPSSLHGAAHAMLAETYYALPDIIGGDLDLAIAMMREARQRDPYNPRYLRLLAAYLLDKAQFDEARSMLGQLLPMVAELEQGKTGGLQLMADQLRVAADLAQRSGNTDLAQRLTNQRNTMLAAHPYLQKRTVVSAMGHFGDIDPMKDPN